MLKKLPSGQPETLKNEDLISTFSQGKVFALLINLLPYLIGLLLVQIPNTKAESIEYFQKYLIFLIFILILNLIKSLIIKITEKKQNESTSKEKIKGKFKDYFNIIVVLLTGALVLFISGFLKYRFNYTERVFQLSILAFSAFFISENFRKKNFILWYLFFDFLYFTLIGVMSVICLNEFYWKVALVFASSVAAFIVSAKVFDFAVSEESLKDNEKDFRTNKVNPIRISLTFLFFPFFITGLAGNLNVLPRRFAILYLIIFGLFRFFERGYVKVSDLKDSNFTAKLKYDSWMFAIVYCVIVVALSL